MQNERASRSKAHGKLIEKGTSKLLKESFLNDGVRLWNMAPVYITKSSSIYIAKKAIEEFASSDHLTFLLHIYKPTSFFSFSNL